MSQFSVHYDQSLSYSKSLRAARDKGNRKHRAAKGLEEREANPRRGNAGFRVQETIGMQAKPSDYPHGTENQLVIRLSEKPTL